MAHITALIQGNNKQSTIMYIFNREADTMFFIDNSRYKDLWLYRHVQATTPLKLVYNT